MNSIWEDSASISKRVLDGRYYVKQFQRAGFVIRSRKGDHIIMVKPGVPRPVVIKTSPRQVPVTTFVPT